MPGPAGRGLGGSLRRAVARSFLGGVSLLAACTTGDGEGARFVGRVVSVSARVVCVGPSTSSHETTCGGVPAHVKQLPKIGQCVGLFAKKWDHGKVVEWSAASLRLDYKESNCRAKADG